VPGPLPGQDAATDVPIGAGRGGLADLALEPAGQRLVAAHELVERDGDSGHSDPSQKRCARGTPYVRAVTGTVRTAYGGETWRPRPRAAAGTGALRARSFPPGTARRGRIWRRGRRGPRKTVRLLAARAGARAGPACPGGGPSTA